MEKAVKIKATGKTHDQPQGKGRGYRWGVVMK